MCIKASCHLMSAAITTCSQRTAPYFMGPFFNKLKLITKIFHSKGYVHMNDNFKGYHKKIHVEKSAESIDKAKKHNLEFKKLEEIAKSDILELMNNPLVLRQMPLAKEKFDDRAYEAFINAKKSLWDKYGYGPWAFEIDGKFAGWGGLQYEHGDADLALVLHPNFWGMGMYIYAQIVKKAFKEMGMESITILLPPTRKPKKALTRLHFKPDGELDLDGELFLRFRLLAKDAMA